MGMILLGFALGGFNSMRQSFVQDEGVADVNQRLKTVLATIGPDMQQIGQGLTDTSIPLVKLEVFNVGTANETSIITTRKVSIPTPLNLSEALIKNQSNTTLKISTDTSILEQWKNKRIADGGTVQGYIHNSATNTGQFFDYKGENLTADPRTITISSTTWTENYPSGSSIYLMDKRKYEVKDNILTLTVNDKDTFKLVEYVEKLNIEATIKSIANNGTISDSKCKGIPESGTPTNCDTTPNNYKFENIKYLDIKATVKQKNKDNPSAKKLRSEDLTMSQKFFIRNTLN